MLSRKAIYSLTATLLSLQSQAFVTKTNFFEELLAKKATGEILNVKAIEDSSLSSENFESALKERVFEDYQPEKFQVSFTQDGVATQCKGALILESQKFSVSKIPVEYQDRAALVMLTDCQAGNNSMSEEVLDYYQIYPLDTTLPLGNTDKITSYRLYDKAKEMRPPMLCTDNDSNSEGVPRAQFFIHRYDNHVTFYTGISRSSPAKQVGDEVIFSDDRALLIEDVDQGSLPEVRATLDYVSLAQKGVLFFQYEKEQCMEFTNGDLNIITCSTEIPSERAVEFQPQADYSEVPLTLTNVKSTVVTRNIERLIPQVNGMITTVKDREYEIEYYLTFDSAAGKRYMRVLKRFNNTSLESRPECYQEKTVLTKTVEKEDEEVATEEDEEVKEKTKMDFKLIIPTPSLPNN